jgi:hypothetical protein
MPEVIHIRRDVDESRCTAGERVDRGLDGVVLTLEILSSTPAIAAALPLTLAVRLLRCFYRSCASFENTLFSFIEGSSKARWPGDSDWSLFVTYAT